MATPEITRLSLPPGSWVVDPDRTVLHAGAVRLREVEGRLEVSDLGIAVASVTVRAASVDTGDAARDERLRRRLDAATHPELSFVSRSIDPGEDGDVVLRGDLTIRGITREIVLRAEVDGTDGRLSLTVTGELDPRGYGMQVEPIRLALDVSAVRRG